MFALESMFSSVADWCVRLYQVVGAATYERFADMTAPIYIGAVLFILILERLMPARPEQPLFSAGRLQDVTWVFLEAIGGATITVAWVMLLRVFYERHLGFLTLDIDANLPSWVTILGVLVLMDFLRWAQHVLHHKVPWLWQFHKIHHSQRNLNLFSDYRYHVLEYVVRQTVFFLPLMILGIAQTEVVWIALILVWHARFYHGNIRTNLGPLRYVFVTPQSHRIHHSADPRHRDRNYGALFSVWDWLFGTQYRGHTEYPETGVHDPDFPLEAKSWWHNLIWMPALQMIYPFRAIGRSLVLRGGRRRLA